MFFIKNKFNEKKAVEEINICISKFHRNSKYFPGPFFVLEADRIVQSMTRLLAIEHNIKIENPSIANSIIRSVMPENIQPKALNFRHIRNRIAHEATFELSIEQEQECRVAYDIICSWFITNSAIYNKYPEYQTAITKTINNKVDDMLTALKLTIKTLEERNKFLETHLELIISNQKQMMSKLDDISCEIKNANDKIIDYQSMISKLVNSSKSEEEEERILQVFSDNCVEKLEAKLQETITKKTYNEINASLKNILGEDNYNKLDEESISFLSSARIMFDSLSKHNDNIDYSGVCLLVTKALERECRKRFYYGFLEFCKEKYGNDYNKYPSTLLNKYRDDILQSKEYTLGAVPFTLLYKRNVETYITDERSILNYCAEKLFINKSIIYILNQLKQIGNNVDVVRQKYRNPSAHTNSLTKIKAKECFDYILDVQNILKNMLSQFNQ